MHRYVQLARLKRASHRLTYSDAHRVRGIAMDAATMHRMPLAARVALQHLVNEQMDVLYKFSQWLHQRNSAGIAGRVHEKALDANAAEYAHRNPEIVRALSSLRQVTPPSVQAEPPAAGAGPPPVGESVLPHQPPFSFPEAQSSARADSHAMSGPPEAHIPHTETPGQFDLNLAPIELSESAPHSFSGHGPQPEMSAPDLTPWFPLGFDHSDRIVPDYMINPLARSSQPGGSHPRHVYVHGRPYVPDWEATRRAGDLLRKRRRRPRRPGPASEDTSEEPRSRRLRGLGRRPGRQPLDAPIRKAGPHRPLGAERTCPISEMMLALFGATATGTTAKDVPGHLETALRERGRWPTEHGAQITMFCINGEIYTAERRKRQDQGLFASQPSYGVCLTHHPPGD